MGIDARQTRRMMNEALDVIVPLLEGGRVSARTDWFTLDNAKLQHASFTRPRMEMAVTNIRSPAGALLAGRHGLGLLSLGGHTDDALAAYAKNWGIYEEAAAAHGRTADRRKFRIAVQMHLADTREQAMEDIRFGVDAWGGYARDVLPNMPVPKDVTDVREFIVGAGRAIIANARGRHPADRAHAGGNRRLRGRAVHVPRLGRLGRHPAQLRTLREARHSPLPGPVRWTAEQL